MGQIYIITGNPFVDAGIYVISGLTRKRIEDIDVDDLRNLYSKILDVYSSDKWGRMLDLIFTKNHPMRHPSAGGREYYEKFLLGLLSDLSPLSDSGTCVSCGKRNKSKVERKSGIGKELVPLTGSADFVNFFPMGSLGLEICSACLLAIQFMPIFLHYCAGKFLLLHSNSDKVMRYWAKIGVNNFDAQIALGNFTGCYSNNINDPVSSFFRSIEDIVMMYEENWVEEDAFIRFYYFVNPGQSPYVEIFDVPSPVFRFIAYVKQVDAYSEWKEMVNRAYDGSRNMVYLRLLSGESIVRYFFRGKGERRVFGNWNLLKFYLKEVREMNEERINAIREFSDRIATVIKSLGSIKRLNQLETAENYAQFRNVLRFLIKDSLRVKFEKPILMFDEYVKLILPEGATGWNEVRDLMLFRIYEVLHDWLIEAESEKEANEQI